MRNIFFSLCVLGLSACATSEQTQMPSSAKEAVAAAPNKVIWHDDYFDEVPAIPIISRAEVFELSDQLKQRINQTEVQKLGNISKTRFLLDLVYTEDSAEFSYNNNETTTAKKTWESKRGNCISLTILAYSIGRALNLPIVMQEVEIPVQFDRRGNLDFLSSHVNTMVMQKDFWFEREGENRGYLIIDFEPQTMVLHKGRALNEDEILSRFYNNLGAEHLVKNQKNAAYAYFKAAILAAPNNSLAYSNLAELYLQTGWHEEAEQTLAHALRINENDVIAMRNMQKIMQMQNRDAEVLMLAKKIEASNAENPHYWIGLGIQAIKNKEYLSAVKHLEKAKKMAHGYAEIHRNLAEAYLHTGNMAGAQHEISQLIDLVPDHPKSIILRNKFAMR
ncbi:tetratricopeptide repeat protein [Undibacterium baiyunense]|uniref:Tetratricopeptide repeat protein n=1 Tax=Undibacterium baiyunense TaxID=2828731 RepID=A0A941I3Q1_9BURK|nr:tetratricopeptide repeat protein [Undibacterium baiyunense]MBR7746661.1 tetratricopeptide repeat protein [Undibacterium baiyunense]